MKLLSIATSLGLAASCANGSVVEKRNSNSWAGSNNYYLHALHPEEQATYINALKSYNTKVVRLWVTGGSDGCAKSSNTHYVPNYEETIGNYANGQNGVGDTLAAIDSILKQLQDAGIKAIISPHDGNKLPDKDGKCYNGCDVYGTTYTAAQFYSSGTAKAQYDARLQSILEYKSPNFGGKQWKDLSEVILAFDIQNEPLIAAADKAAANDPDDWLCGRAGNMKKILGNSQVKIATGGVGGSQYGPDHEFNLIDKAAYCSAIDIISVHGYMSRAQDWAYYIPKLADQARDRGKLLMMEEWGVGTYSQDNVATQAKVFNDAGVPWLYWMIIPGKSSDESCDGQGACCHASLDPANEDKNIDYEISITSKRADWKTLIQTAGSTGGRQDWSGLVY